MTYKVSSRTLSLYSLACSTAVQRNKKYQIDVRPRRRGQGNLFLKYMTQLPVGPQPTSRETGGHEGGVDAPHAQIHRPLCSPPVLQCGKTMQTLDTRL